MGVYIPKMEMPTCYTCQLESICNKWAKHDAEWQKENRYADCPLVEVKPHGRLIDADALTGELQTTNGDENNGAKLLLDVFLEVLKSAPTIIEADNTQNMSADSEGEE